MSSQPAPSAQPPKSIIIIGAGIIGASIAHQLAHLSHPALVLEQCQIACAASGKSGGFLAKDWCDSSPVKRLARPSFQMHKQFADSLPHDIGYRSVQSYSLSMLSPHATTASRQTAVQTLDPNLSWLDGRAKFLTKGTPIGSTSTNAQVLPAKLTHAMLQQAEQMCGTRVKYARVENVCRTEADKWDVRIVEKDGSAASLQCDIVVLAMGPWSIQAKKWFPVLPPIVAHKAASIVVKAKVPATAVFTEYVNSRGQVREPEAYPRVDEVYLCQSAVPQDLPDDPDQIHIHEQDKADLVEFAQALSVQLEQAMQKEENLVAQACNLPISPDGVPVIGAVPGTNGSVFVATGHSCWGVLNSHATGKAIAELIVRGKSSIDVTPFSPSRFG